MSSGQEAQVVSETIANRASPFPEKGIAARYPGDQGIGKDPHVIFAEDFEIDSIDDLRTTANRSITSGLA
jgi:hypothetical protein